MYRGATRLPTASASARVARKQASRLRRGGPTIGAVGAPPSSPDTHTHRRDGSSPSRPPPPPSSSLPSSLSSEPHVSFEVSRAHSHGPLPLLFRTWMRDARMVDGAVVVDLHADKDDADTLPEAETAQTRLREETGDEDVTTADAVLGASLPVSVSQWRLTSALTMAPRTAPVLSLVANRRPIDVLFTPPLSQQQPLAPLLSRLPDVVAPVARALRDTCVASDVRGDAFSCADVRCVQAFSEAIGQRVPSMVVLTEEPRTNALDDRFRRGHVCASLSSSSTPMWLPWRCPDKRVFSLPTMALPVEVREHRLHVCDALASHGTPSHADTSEVSTHIAHSSAFARAFAKAQRELAHAPWSSVVPSSKRVAPPHCVWNGVCWVLEEDAQLIEAQEKVLAQLRSQSSSSAATAAGAVTLRAWLPPYGLRAAQQRTTQPLLFPAAFVHSTLAWALPKQWLLTGLQTFLSAECGTVHQKPDERLSHTDPSAARADIGAAAEHVSAADHSESRKERVKMHIHVSARAPMREDKGQEEVTQDRAVVPQTCLLAYSPSPPVETRSVPSSWWVSLLTRRDVRHGLHFPPYDALTGLPLRPTRAKVLTSLRRQLHSVHRGQLFRRPNDDDDDLDSGGGGRGDRGLVNSNVTNPFSVGAAGQHVCWWPLTWLLQHAAHASSQWCAPHALPAPLLTDKGLADHLASTGKKRRGRRPSRATQQKWLCDASATLLGEKSIVGFFVQHPPQWFMNEVRHTLAGDGSLVSWLRSVAPPVDPREAVWETSAPGEDAQLPSPRSGKTTKARGTQKTRADAQLLWVLEYTAGWADNSNSNSNSNSRNSSSRLTRECATACEGVRWHVYAITDNALLNFVFPFAEAAALLAASPSRATPPPPPRETPSSDASDNLEELVWRGCVFVEIRAALWCLASVSATERTPISSPLHRLLTDPRDAHSTPWSSTRSINALVEHIRSPCSWTATDYASAMRTTMTPADSWEVVSQTDLHKQSEQGTRVARDVVDSQPDVAEQDNDKVNTDDVASVRTDVESIFGPFVLRENNGVNGSDTSGDLPAIDRRRDTAGRRLIDPQYVPSNDLHESTDTQRHRDTALAASLKAARSDPDALHDVMEDSAVGVVRTDHTENSHCDLLEACAQAEQNRFLRRWSSWRRYISHSLPVVPCPVREAYEYEATHLQGPALVTSDCLGLTVVTLQTEKRYVNAVNVLLDGEMP